ncbi:MAG: right-handed parallel beta-helix repeat-containing protein [Thermoplasmata archaeon]|nr:MAG: right-handed parallel beta-helix repeat-containing protein [Thermoplasmata archaeon]
MLKRSSIIVSMLFIISITMLIIPDNNLIPTSSAATIYVPTDYPTIQDAINASKDGDTVYVYSGTYYENIIVNKTINLTGENQDTTIIDGLFDDVITITEDWVNITGFTLIGSDPIPKEGIKLNNVQNCSIMNNNISLNRWGIHLDDSSNNIIVSNNVSTLCGIYLDYSDNNNITDNKVTTWDSRWGIYVYYSFNNTIISNNIAPGGIRLGGDQLSHFNSHDIPTNNIINGKPLYYYKDCSGFNIDGIPVGQLILVNCSDINAKNLHINDTTIGINVAFSTNINITNNNVSDNYDTIMFWYSSGNNITGNKVSDSVSGIKLISISNSNITNNDVPLGGTEGISLHSSSNNNIKDNNVSYSNKGVELRGSCNNNNVRGNNLSYNFYSISLSWSSNNNTITSNKAYWNGWGIFIRDSNNNIIKNNTIILNYLRGITLESSSNNRIYHNNIINNTDQAFDDMNDNFWDDSYPSGGNYWSDFDEPSEGAYDDYLGREQNLVGRDGIVDNGSVAGGGKNPYVIDADSQDNYPLLELFEASIPPLPPPILYINVSPDKKNVTLNWDPPSDQDFDPYLIYRSKDPTNFDFSSPWINTLTDMEPDETTLNPERTMWNDTNAAFPGNATNYNEEYYYVIRAFNDRNQVSATSRTVGKWTKTFLKDVSTFSLPLEPLQPITVDYLLNDMNATYIKWMNSTTHTWMKHGDGGNNDRQIIVGEGYEVKFSSQTNYTFTGLPGAMISFNNDTGFLGFNTSSESKNLTVSVEPDGNVSIIWKEPIGMGVGGWYEVYYSNRRDGFFGTFDEDYFLACPIVNYGNNTATHIDAQAANPGARLYYLVVPFNVTGDRGTSTYSIGIWTEEYSRGYDSFGIPLKLKENYTADWYCDNIPDTVGINYFNNSKQRWCWHSTVMPEGAFDTVLKMSVGYQISTSSATKFTFIGK